MGRELWVVEVYVGGVWYAVPKTAVATEVAAKLQRRAFRRTWRSLHRKDATARVQCYAAALAGVCRRCGCSDAFACPEGCAWADNTMTLCTACVGPAKPLPKRRPQTKSKNRNRLAARRARRRR